MAQPPAGPPPRLSAKDAAPEDITGYWVSIVTEDWRWRMLTPAKGDITSVPLNPVGRKTAEAWDPAKDEAAGEQCKAYGAPGLMRLPTRLHITWQDDNTLKVETDEGTQTRLFHFAGKLPPGQAASWQGYSAAEWDVSHPTFMGFAPPPPPAGGKLPGSLEGDHHQPASRLSAQERHPLWRGRHAHRIFHAYQRSQRRFLAPADQHRTKIRNTWLAIS